MNRAILLPAITEFPSPWTTLYSQGLTEGLAQLGWELERPPLDEIYGSLAGTKLPCVLQSPWDAEKYSDHVPGIKLFSHIHGAPCVPFGNWSKEDRYTENYLVNRCRRVFTCSRYTATFLNREYAAGAVVAGFPVALPKPFPSRQRRIVLVPGRLDFDRIPQVLMEAFAGQDVPAVFCTPQSREESDFAKWAKDGYLDYEEFSNVHVEFGVTMDGYDKLLERAACVVIGSQIDNLNLSACQALARGVPVVAPGAGSFPEFCDLQLLYEPYSLRSIRAKVEQAMRSPPQAHRPNGKLHALTTPAIVVQHYVNAFLELR